MRKNNVQKALENERNVSSAPTPIKCEPSIKGKMIQILTDSVTTAAYVNFQGGVRADLSSVATKIWVTALKYNLKISAKWLAGKLNTTTDRLSHLDDKANSKIHLSIFKHLDSVWGPHTVDRFA